MKDTIKAINGYSVRYAKNKRTNEEVAVLYDGMACIMIAKKCSFSDYCENEKQNEMFEFMEKFTTRNGNEFIYWVDKETGEDFLTKITGENYEN